MSLSNNFILKFAGLKDGKHKFEYEADLNFFKLYDYSEFNDAKTKFKIDFIKKSTVLELQIVCEGVVNINCTLSNEPFDYNLESQLKLIVKFGEYYDNSNDELLILPQGSHSIYLDQFLYEMVVLSMPIRNVHPGIEDGSIKSDIINRLKDFDINKEKSSNFDPRWDKLKQLKK